MEIRYTRKAEEQFRKLSRDVQQRIAKKMRFFSEQADPLKFAKRLTDTDDGVYRFRIGRWRVRFDIVYKTIYVVKVAIRDKSYDD